jgi:hypothetical protein
MIRWQGRRNRHRSGPSLWAILLVLFALTGAAAMGAQAAGWTHLTGMAAYMPGLLLLLAVSMQAVVVLRAGFKWLAG